MMKRTHETIYMYAIYISYTLYILAVGGITIIDPKYITYLDTFIKYYISLFLMWKFNIFRTTKKITEFDKQVVFAAGSLLFISSAAFDYINSHYNKILSVH